MPINTLVIPGGGLNFFVFYGIIKTVNQQNIWQYNNLTSIYSASCGTIIALLILSKLKWDDIDTYILDRPWHKTWQLDIHTIINSLSSNGFLDIHYLETFFIPIFKACGWNQHITLKELYDITKIDLYIFATRFNDFKSIVFHHKKYPDLPIISACYMSCSLIPLFKPLNWKDNYYIDGFYSGIDNPIVYALKNKKETELFTFNYLINPNNKPISHNIENTSLFELTFIILTKMLDKQFRKYYKKSKIKTTNQVHLYFIPFTAQPWKDILYDKNIRENLINEGIKYASMYVKYNH